MKSKLAMGAEDKIVFTLKRKTQLGLLLFIGVWLMGWITVVTTFSLGLIEDAQKRNAEICFYLVVIFLVGLWVLKVFLWLLRGKEQISLDENNLIIERKGTFFTVKRKYETSLIDNFSLSIDQTVPFWYRLYGFGGGQIMFEYLEQQKYFGQTLSPAEANEIIDQLNKHLQKVVANRSDGNFTE